jgi:YHS domain-containing protein
MKNLLFLVIILFIGAGLSFNSYAQEKSDDEKKESKTEMQTQEAEKTDDGKPFNTICPVSHEDVDPEITYEYEGKTYAVCCNNCLKRLKSDPEKYISRLSEDGKSIKKKENK